MSKGLNLLTPEEAARQSIALHLLDAGVVFLEAPVFVKLVHSLYRVCEVYAKNLNTEEKEKPR